MKTVKAVWFVYFSIVLLGCNHDINKELGLTGELVIFHAGSLSVPIHALADSFNELHPNLKIQPEAAGSLACIRKITDLNRTCDILASADYLLIDKLMIPNHAEWNIKFAVNEMSIVFTDRSKLKDSINQNNWSKVLLSEDVRFGRSDPTSDPCGYRTILTLELAEKALEIKDLARDVLEKDTRYIRPKEVDLLALLESNTVDYIFIYKSVALQHQLPYLELPDSINLGDPTLTDWYSRVSVQIPGNSPDEMITQHGEAIIYGITIPNTYNNKVAAQEFIKFILSKKGRNIIESCYQTPLDTAQLSIKSTPPDWL